MELVVDAVKNLNRRVNEIEGKIGDIHGILEKQNTNISNKVWVEKEKWME